MSMTRQLSWPQLLSFACDELPRRICSRLAVQDVLATLHGRVKSRTVALGAKSVTTQKPAELRGAVDGFDFGR